MRTGFASTEMHLEPVLAYDRIAPHFQQISARRRPYLAAIEELVAANIPKRSRSLLDIGSGDGARAVRIASAAGIEDLVLLEPSSQMRKQWPAGVRGWAMRAEDLGRITEVFDVITCLWNVLGHICPAANRANVLRCCARLLPPEGRMFVDLNHRYNALHYGFVPTAFRFLRDLAHPGEHNGDVHVRWDINGARYTTDGHVFRHREFRRLARAACLTIEKSFTVHYGNGSICRSKFTGNPLYILRRTD